MYPRLLKGLNLNYYKCAADTDRQLTVISSEAQTLYLVDLLSTHYTDTVCKNPVTNRTSISV